MEKKDEVGDLKLEEKRSGGSRSPCVPHRCAQSGADESVEGEAFDEVGIDHKGDAEQQADDVALPLSVPECGKTNGAENNDDEKRGGIGHWLDYPLILCLPPKKIRGTKRV